MKREVLSWRLSAGYNSGNFDDMAAPSASSALSSIPSNIAAQGLGIADAANVSNNINTNTFTFMPLGPVPTQTLDEFRSSLSGSAQAVPVAQTHRTSLKNVAYHVSALSVLQKCVGNEHLCHQLRLLQ